MTVAEERLAQSPAMSRYEIQKTIGSGGMGTVYRALDRETNELVALKVLDVKLSENATVLKRLAREFRAAHELEHPNIVRAIAFEQDGDRSFVVYELVDGCSLGDRLETQGRFEEPEAVRIITQVAQALHYAHERKVVHRDVKPDNIMLLPDGRVKLTDFGLAKDYSSTDEPDLTKAASGLGTPHFMAPEQFYNAKTAGPLCDVYSLGATFFNLVTGELPFDAKAPIAILGKKMSGNLLSDPRKTPYLSDQACRAIRAAVHPEPEGRPASCLEFFKMLTTPLPATDALICTPQPLASRLGFGANKRASARYTVKIGSVASIDVGVHAESGDREIWPLAVQDISKGGLRVLLARRFEAGTAIEIELDEGSDQPKRRVSLRVVRVKRDKSGHWSHGCSFAEPMAEAALKRLVKRF